jgi:hypothetical protein
MRIGAQAIDNTSAPIDNSAVAAIDDSNLRMVNGLETVHY